MSELGYRGRRLHVEDVDLAAIAHAIGTPCYVYSSAAIERRWHEFERAFAGVPHLVCYAVKANGNLAVLDLLARAGAGFDVVSVGELERVLAAGGDAGRTVFAGVGKRAEEIRRALEAGIRCLNVESEGEIERIEMLAAALGTVAPIAVRVNPDVDARTHPYIATGLSESKFGVPFERAVALYERARRSPHLAATGVACHIGSQLTEVAPFRDALGRVAALVGDLRSRGHPIRHVDVGGGLGVRYRDESPPTVDAYAAAVREAVGDLEVEVVTEPGRAIVAEAGVLLTTVEYVKFGGAREFAVVDAAMNDLLRPALYQAWHDVLPLARGHGEPRRLDVVGPVCESGDFLARDRTLAVAPGDVLAVCTAGAYGFVMSSTYNARPRPPEVMVRGARWHCVRPRESVAALYAGETLLPR